MYTPASLAVAPYRAPSPAPLVTPHRNPPIIRTQVFFRAVYACPWAKSLWLQAFLPGPLRRCLTPDERRDCLRLMVGKGLLVRVDPPAAMG